MFSSILLFMFWFVFFYNFHRTYLFNTDDNILFIPNRPNYYYKTLLTVGYYFVPSYVSTLAINIQLAFPHFPVTFYYIPPPTPSACPSYNIQLYVFSFFIVFQLTTPLPPSSYRSAFRSMEFHKSFTPNHTPKAFFRAIYYSPSVKWPFAKCRLDTITFQTIPRTFSFFFSRLVLLRLLLLHYPPHLSPITSIEDRHLTVFLYIAFFSMVIHQIKKLKKLLVNFPRTIVKWKNVIVNYY